MSVNKSLQEAVNTRDLIAIRSAIYTIILSDPGFKTGKFDEAWDYIKTKEVEGLFDSSDDERILPEEEWNDSYFDELVSELPDCFSEERVSKIKRVGRKLYSGGSGRSNSGYQGNYQFDHKVEDEDFDSTLSAYKKKRPYGLLGIIAIVVGIVIIFKLIFKGDE